MSREFKMTLAVLLPVVLTVAVLRPRNRQEVNMAVAREQLPRVEEALRADERFKEVKASVYTGQDGAVGLVGKVENHEDLYKLMQVMAAEQLPVALHWEVEVRADVPEALGP